MQNSSRIIFENIFHIHENEKLYISTMYKTFYIKNKIDITIIQVSLKLE